MYKVGDQINGQEDKKVHNASARWHRQTMGREKKEEEDSPALNTAWIYQLKESRNTSERANQE